MLSETLTTALSEAQEYEQRLAAVGAEKAKLVADFQAQLAAGKERENALDAIKDNYRDVVVPALKREIEALKKLQAEGASARPFCEIDEGFEVRKLDVEVQTRLASVLEWLELFRVQVIDRILANTKWGGVGSSLSMIDMRQVNVYCGAYTILLDLFGNKAWLKELVRVAKGLLKLTVREFIPGFDPRFARAEDKGGPRRFLYAPHLTFPNPPTPSHLAAGALTDGHDLDKDLSDGTCVGILVPLHANREFDPETKAVYADWKDFCYGLWERRALYTQVFNPKAFATDPDFWGKPLNHPTVAMATANGQMHRMFGNEPGGERFKRAYDRLKGELLADREYVETPYGELYAAPHGVQEGYKREQRYAGQPQVGAHQGLQDCTYIAEAFTYAELANRAGLDVFDDRTLKAIGRSLHYCVMYDGYGAKTIGGSIGGGGRPVEGYGTRKRQVNLRGGESFPSRWVEPEAGFREGMHQLTRNLTTLPMARIMKGKLGEEIDAGLRVTLKNAEREGYERFGPRMTLLMAASERA